MRLVLRALAVTAIFGSITFVPGATTSALQVQAIGTDLSVTVASHAAIPRTGGGSTLSAVVSNGGGGQSATGVGVIYLPPAGATYDPALGGQGACSVDSGLIVCALGSIGAGQSTKLNIGLRSAGGEAGTLLGSFFPPRSDQWDPNAGELLHQAWDVEADGQGESVRHCWPVERLAPNMDIDGGGEGHHEACDGKVDHPAPAPITTELQERFPDPYKANVTRSWEWRTRITPAAAGEYRICSSQIDDGGYVALTPVGAAADNSSIVLDVETYNVERNSVVPLTGGTTYDVLIRVVNRGADGLNNGGGFPGGWGYVGMTPASDKCSAASSAAFGANALALTPRTPGNLILEPAAALEVTGAITDPAASWSEARFENHGPDGDLIFAAAQGGETVNPFGLEPGQTIVIRTDIADLGTASETARWSVAGSSTVPPQP